MEMAGETTFQIAYEGEALEDGSMDVRELAPALMSLSDLIQDANEVLHGKESEVSLNIEGSDDGSFAVDLALWAAQDTTLIDVATSPPAEGLSNILDILGFATGFGGGAGLLQLIRDYGGQMPESVEEVEDRPGQVKMNFEGDNNTVIVHQKTPDLYNSRKARRHAQGVVKPLKQPGITGFRAGSSTQTNLRISNTEVTKFDDFEGEEQLLNKTENVQLFAIADISFNPDNMWRLSDGGNVHYVTMSDENFVERFQDGQIPVTTKDNLRVRLATRQYRKRNGDLRIEREVVEVIEHIQYSQLDMFDNEEDFEKPEDES